MNRLRIVVRGAVQGVGFRPYVHRLATSLDLAGWVCNTGEGVRIEVEGEATAAFLERLPAERPPLASIQSLEHAVLDPSGYRGFVIRESDAGGRPTAIVMPDIATCADCRREILDPMDRRFAYPFTNCTNCGPRFSIVEALPYDRANTTMKSFEMCSRCRSEYDAPRDRRFHAQPNACPKCGPRLSLPFAESARAIRDGKIVAMKGIGGFHLMVDARNEAAVRRLRQRKLREEKPFALLVPEVPDVRTLEAQLLRSPEAPIVLVRRCLDVAQSVAPNNPYLGIMLPSNPLHLLLMEELKAPVVATSGNRSDEPICVDNEEALRRLGDIADVFVLHTRPIARRVDDSIVRVVDGRAMMIRRARGYAPLPITMGSELPAVLAVGGQLKATAAAAIGSRVFVTQHLGDLDTPEADDAFRESIEGFAKLYDFKPERVVCDAHPDYRSTRYAEKLGEPVRVQHHAAHVYSCMADNELAPPVLGVAWDGAGLGADHTIWGGEFLRVTDAGWERFDHLRTFRVPADGAARDPRRAAEGVLHEIGETVKHPEALRLVTSSAGRLFDAVAALLFFRRQAGFEGQAAMELEFSIDPTDERYEIDGTNWEPLIRGVLRDRDRPRRAAAKFHNSLVEILVSVARRAREERVVLTGGCFQNVYLAERAARRLREEGFRPYLHQRVPPNDGGLSLGQVNACVSPCRANSSR